MSALSFAVAFLEGGEVNRAVASDDASDDFVNLSSFTTLTYERFSKIERAPVRALFGLRRVKFRVAW